ncbi:MAG: hypothetical protein ACFFD4_00400 [Candidatus Odinarchaeota archaeon]
MALIDANFITLFIFVIGLISIFLILLYSAYYSEEEEQEEED